MSVDSQIDIEKVRFNSPEELANKLESKSKNALARRIKEISAQAESNSQNAREQIKQELNASEKKEIKDTFWSWIDEIFSEQTTTVGVQASGWNTENTGNKTNFEKIQEKFEWFWKRFNNAKEVYEKIKEVNKWWIMWTISGIMAAIAYFFSKKIPNLPDGMNFSFDKWKLGKDEKNGGSSEKVWEGDENEKVEVDNITTKWLIEFNYKWSDKNNVSDVASKNTFQELTISEIQEISKSDSKINDWVNKTYPNWNKEKIQTVKSTFALFNKWWKVYEILKKIHGNENWEFENTKLFKLIKIWATDIKIFDILKTTKPQDFPTIWFELFNTNLNNIDNDKSKITKNLAWFIISNNDINTTISFWELNKKLSSRNLDNTEQIKLKEILEFWNNFINQINNNTQLNLWSWKEIAEAFNKKPMSILEATQLYIVFDWKYDFNEATPIKQTMMYFAVNKLLDWNRWDFKQWKYLSDLFFVTYDSIEWAWNNIKIPQWVQDTLWNLAEKMKDYIIKELKDISETIAWFVSENPKLIFAIMAIFIVYPFAQRKSILLNLILPNIWRKK